MPGVGQSELPSAFLPRAFTWPDAATRPVYAGASPCSQVGHRFCQSPVGGRRFSAILAEPRTEWAVLEVAGFLVPCKQRLAVTPGGKRASDNLSGLWPSGSQLDFTGRLGGVIDLGGRRVAWTRRGAHHSDLFFGRNHFYQAALNCDVGPWHQTTEPSSGWEA